MSNPTHYSGPELGALLAQVREELGEEATILEANKVRSGGIAGFFAKESFEISASTIAADELVDGVIDDLGDFDDYVNGGNIDTMDEPTIDNSLAHNDSMLRDDIMIHNEPVVLDKPMNHNMPDELDEIAKQSESELFEVLEPLDVIGDLAGKPLQRKARVKSPGQPNQDGLATETEQPAPPARIADDPTPDRPTLVFNFENLGPSAIPRRLQHTEPTSSREPIPTPSPLRSQLESSSVPSTTVGERVADALMERAELVNALEHLDKTDELIAAQFDESPESLATLSDAALSDATFDQILQRTLSTPHVEEIEEQETITTAEAVAQRIASQDMPDTVSTETLNTEPEQAETPDREEPEQETGQSAGDQTETKQVSTQSSNTEQTETIPLVQEPDQEPAAANTQPIALAPVEPIPTEPGATREHPDFWTRMDLAKEEIALYQLGRSNVTAIVGPLDLALPIARRCQQDDWIGVQDLAILSTHTSIPGVPSWQAVSKVDDLYWAMNEWCANQRRGLVVVDTADLSSSQLLRHITQLRSNGADMVRLAMPAGLDVADFVTLSDEIGGKLAVDLPSGTKPNAILGALDEGLTIGSVGGRPLTPELLVALRIEVSRIDVAHMEVSQTTATSNTPNPETLDNDVTGNSSHG